MFEPKATLAQLREVENRVAELDVRLSCRSVPAPRRPRSDEDFDAGMMLGLMLGFGLAYCLIRYT